MEIEAFSMQRALKDFFNDPNNLKAFNDECCKKTPTSLPVAMINGVKKAYEKNVASKKKDCEKRFPKT